MTNAPDYLNPNIAVGLARVPISVVDATPEALDGYGQLVNSPEDVAIEIVRWPAQGWRPVDSDSGDQGGTTEGTFISEWRGDILYDRNEAVRAAADHLHKELSAMGIDVVLDDRGERPGVMFADWELVGVPHRITVGDRGLKDNNVEYQHRRDDKATAVPVPVIAHLVKSKIARLATLPAEEA